MFSFTSQALGGRRTTRFDPNAVRAAIDRSMAVIEFDVDGTILDANDNFCAAVGYDRGEIVGKHHRIFVDEKLRASQEYAEFWARLVRGEYVAGKFKRIAKDGSEIWIEASYNPVLGPNGEPMGVVKIAADVTAEMLENMLIKAKVDAIGRSQAVIQFDMKGVVIDANDNFLNTVGYRLDEIKGKHHSQFVTREEREGAAYKKFWADLAAGEFRVGEFLRVGKSGRPIWLQASYNPVFDPDGVPMGVVKFATDITTDVERREAVVKVGAQVEGNLDLIVKAVSDAQERSTSAGAGAAQTLNTVQSVAAAAEEFRVSTEDIAQSMTRSAEEAARVDQATEKASASTENLAGAAQSMSNIVELIEGIAGKINLLALNATIEAARAGEAGKGFAVVASEVKLLARQVEKATTEIGGEIGSMQSTTAEVVAALKNIAEAAKAVNATITAVAGAVDEQSAISAEIASNMTKASDASSEINAALDGVAAAIGETDQLARASRSHCSSLHDQEKTA